MLTLSNRIAVVEKRKRIGRGGSRGGTSGKGSKGQKARTGGSSKIRACFEGGQMPLHRRLPKRGFNNTQFAIEYSIVNIKQLEKCFNSGDVVTKESMFDKGIISKKTNLVKVLGFGSLTKKLNVSVDAFSVSAQDAIRASGGEVNTIKKA